MTATTVRGSAVGRSGTAADPFLALRAFPRILAEHWPALLAWYLAGGVVRLGIMYAAAPLSATQPVLALLCLPLAVLARLVAYVAMFLTVRRSMPGYAAAIGGLDERVGARESIVRFSRLIFPAVAPFFLVYGLVGGVEGDLSTYAHITYKYNFLGRNDGGIGVGSGPIVVAIIVLAFVLRQVLSRIGDRLHESVVLLEIYLEATWTFVAVAGISNVLGGVITWVQDREVVSLITDTREALVGIWHGFEYALDGIDGLVPLVSQFVLNPLLWIFVAALIYTQSLVEVRAVRIIPRRIEIHARARLSLLPRPLANAIRGLAGDWDEIYKPAIVGARMIGRLGLPALAVALAAFGVLYAAGQWGSRAVVLAIGPHEVDFWQDAVGVLNIAIASILEPIRIALLASTFDGMLRAWRRGRDGDPDAVLAPAAARPEGTQPERSE